MFPSLYKYTFRFKVAYKEIRDFILKMSNYSLFFFSFIGFMFVIYDIGYDHADFVSKNIIYVYTSLVYILFCSLFANLVLTISSKRSFFSIILDMILLSYLLFSILSNSFIPESFNHDSDFVQLLNEKIFIYITFTILFIIEFSLKTLGMLKRNVNPALLFIFSFAFIIVIGSFLLMLPNSTTDGISLIDAIFTSTSAVCVTGLIVVDTATTFTMLGKTIIMGLIQIGGLGIMTFTSFLGIMFQSNSSFSNQMMLKDIIIEEKLGEIFHTISKIILITFLIEFIGALIIFASIAHLGCMDLKNKIYFSIFHSISGFCNAGFSTFTDGLYESTVRYNYNLHLIIAFLVICGGLGFPILFNYYRYFKHFLKNKIRQTLTGERYRHLPLVINVNTRIVLFTTIILLAFGTLFIFITEYNNTLSELSLRGKVVSAFFASVTPRTAGFNTINMGLVLNSTSLIIIFLMWIGASPGSTGGGIKTTTFAISIFNAINVSRGKNRIELFNREIPELSIRRAYSIMFMSILIIGLSTFLISVFDPQMDIFKVVFECFSAFSTVGLSLGITPELSTQSKTVIIFLMYIGRVGTITLLIAMVNRVKILSYRYPIENIYIN